MVMERLDAAKRLPENQDQIKQFAIEQAKRLLRSGKVKDPGPKEQVKAAPAKREASPKVELNLGAEWERQAKKYVVLDFHKELGLTEQEYIDSLPNFTPRPEAFRTTFDIPVLVETRISVERQCKLAVVEYYLKGLDLSDWADDPKSYKMPDGPYITWMQDGGSNKGKNVTSVRKDLREDERGATVFDGIALYLAHPEILRRHYIDLPGTKVGSDNAPYLGLWDGRLRLDYRWVVDTDLRFGSASCGRV